MLTFPDVEDIRLGQTPLSEVICQVRFPPILRIANERPVAFQDNVRAEFPQLVEKRGLAVQLPSGDDAPASVRVQNAPSLFQFLSEDGTTKITLATDFYALSTETYQHWEDFWALIRFAHAAVYEVYEPSYAVRVGLRYVNQMTPSNTGLDSQEALLDVLRADLVAPLRQEPWDMPLEALTRILLAGESEGERLTLRVGFKKAEPVLLLDLDYFAEGRIHFDLLEDFYPRAHEVVYRAFRWAIPDEQLTAFAPVAAQEV